MQGRYSGCACIPSSIPYVAAMHELWRVCLLTYIHTGYDHCFSARTHDVALRLANDERVERRYDDFRFDFVFDSGSCVRKRTRVSLHIRSSNATHLLSSLGFKKQAAGQNHNDPRNTPASYQPNPTRPSSERLNTSKFPPMNASLGMRSSSLVYSSEPAYQELPIRLCSALA